MQPMAPAAEMHDPAGPVSGEEMTAESPEEGYRIVTTVTRQGFTVSQEPLEAEGQPDMAGAEGMVEAEPQMLTTFEDALKAAVRIYKQDPIGASDDKHFDSGFEQGHGSQGMEVQ